MNIGIALDVLLALSGCLALIGLGGVVATWTRVARRKDVTVTVEMADRERQSLTFPSDSPIVQRLAPILKGINFLPPERITEKEAGTEARRRPRLFDRAGLVVGAAAAAAGAFPFIGREAAPLAIIAAGGLALTRFGEILSPLMRMIESHKGHRVSAEEKAKILAALFVGEDSKAMKVGHWDASPPGPGSSSD